MLAHATTFSDSPTAGQLSVRGWLPALALLGNGVLLSASERPARDHEHLNTKPGGFASLPADGHDRRALLVRQIVRKWYSGL